MAVTKFLTRLFRDNRGLAAVEYGFLCGLIVIVMVGALGGLANVIILTWSNIQTQSQNAVNQANGN
jgi:pilus assembly protein Flp/PilA